ncbi:MAG TPA: trehalose-6-phosphate synthase [Burkholderiaceae bacterium]|nr:trehalose-6-phosphate synthase [Burkholderiaceae bacterium]
MRLSLRFLLPLVLAMAVLAYVVVPLVDSLTLQWFVRDLDVRAQLIAGTLQKPLATLVPEHDRAGIEAVLNGSIHDDRLYALAFCDPSGNLLYRTTSFPSMLGCNLPSRPGGRPRSVIHLPQGPLHATISPLDADGQKLGELVVLHDMSFVERRSADTRRYVILLFGVLAVIVSLITVLVAQLSWRGWVSGVRAILRGPGLARPLAAAGPEIQPLMGDLHQVLREIDEERRIREESTPQWSAGTIRQLLHDQLSGDEVIVVSNREPYIHTSTADGIVVRRPASGLVTAVEPVMRACSGTWIAHGSGSADRETVDRDARIAVPPDDPAYTLRRVWLSAEEEQGYYFGFANEGLWPLCHIAHVRPVFRAGDWEQYVAVNQRFAEAVVTEARTDNPIVLVQDYHFALLPKMVRERLPRATIITFWHIPWPNPESFGICPWREQILEGLLGSTILGFHTRFHCKNFIETVDRYLEARIEHELSKISYRGKPTVVANYPISIHWPVEEAKTWKPVAECRAALRRELGVADDYLLALGIDRLDYTKGIIERLLAAETMLEQHPDLIGHFSLIQIAAPSRSSLEEYQNFEAKVRATAERINQRFAGGNGYQAIILKIEHHKAQSVIEYYRACDVCVVTSLHDGMNLVAKEFVAARDDEQGALILSQFAGASRELHEALIVNPYNTEQTAEALYQAVTMPGAEQRERMRSLRRMVRDFNVYRWAGRMLLDASHLRQRERTEARIDSHSRASVARNP